MSDAGFRSRRCGTRGLAAPAIFVMLLGLACEPVSAPERRFRWSSEPEISLPSFESRAWNWADQVPVLEYAVGSPQYGRWAGFLLDRDGTVWQFVYPPQDPTDAARCELSVLPRGTREFSECRYRDSRLIARVSDRLLRQLLKHVASVEDGPRHGDNGVVHDGGFSGIELTGYVRTDGKPLLIAGCGTPRFLEQLASPHAEAIIDLWRRLRRALPRSPFPGACMLALKEVAPGVPGWWIVGPRPKP